MRVLDIGDYLARCVIIYTLSLMLGRVARILYGTLPGRLVQGKARCCGRKGFMANACAIAELFDD